MVHVSDLFVSTLAAGSTAERARGSYSRPDIHAAGGNGAELGSESLAGDSDRGITIHTCPSPAIMPTNACTDSYVTGLPQLSATATGPACPTNKEADTVSTTSINENKEAVRGNDLIDAMLDVKSALPPGW